jgi:selenide,water dikinase
MATLNAAASAEALAAGVRGMTDVTGFGLVGHLHHLCRESGLAAELDASAVPAIDGVEALLRDDAAISGGSRRNAEWAADFATFGGGVAPWRRHLVTDATTSGGLLAAVAPERAHTISGAVVGRLVDGPAGTITVS